MNAPIHAPAPAEAARLREMREMRRKIGQLRASNYDISAVCNLTCEGCLFFAKGGAAPVEADTDAAWEARFAAEAVRGVNFAYLAGVEPSMTPQRIASAWRHIKAGVVFTNGTRRIDPQIGYRIHVSLWGLGETAAKLRGGDSTSKALRLYGTDPRAVFVFTVTAQNIDQILPIAAACAEAGARRLTYSFFSPTLAYQARKPGDAQGDYMRLDEDMRLSAADFAEARALIAEAQAMFPGTVRYSMDYHDWVTQPSETLYTLDEDGIALDCGNRLSDFHRHYEHDGSASAGTCCSPNLDCRDCRAYAMALGTFVSRRSRSQAERAARLRATHL